MKNVQISPAARKPLYNPWLAAIALVGSNNSEGKPLKIALPLVVQANISNQRIYRWSAAMKPIRIVVAKFNDYRFSSINLRQYSLMSFLVFSKAWWISSFVPVTFEGSEKFLCSRIAFGAGMNGQFSLA